MAEFDFDVLVVGSGFGGSVTALRATEKGYRVGVLEAGRRFDTSTLPRSSWQLRRFLWAPALGLRGIQRITPLKDVAVLSGAPRPCVMARTRTSAPSFTRIPAPPAARSAAPASNRANT